MVELSASWKAVVVDGIVLLTKGGESLTIARREAEVLARASRRAARR